MKVLFVGGTGVISQAVSRLAVEKGIELYLFNRGRNKEFVPEGAKVIVGDIRDIKSSKEILRDYHFDAVVDWIVYTPEQARADLEIFKDMTDQYIFISSASVYQKPPTDYLITESTPLANPYWQYSRDKIACEKLFMDEYRENGFPVTIVRPSHTYGNTMIPAVLNSDRYPWTLIDRMLKGKKVIVHGDGTSLWTLTHNTDFAKGFIGLLGNMKSIGHAFHITSDEVLNWNQIYQTIGRAVGAEVDIVHISSDFIVSKFPEKEGSLLGDKAISCVFDNSKIKRFVPEFKATVPFAEGIRQTIEWFRSDPDRCRVDQEWDEKMDDLIEQYESK
ncbi:MAG: SDR family oxidoreductase [Halanaerobiaceae bacterium]|jgi:nucleoside-diphosphate-sugar epimerase|nr:SDR family oxidoreductase [Halanaerobiaceae bacterium]